MRRAKEKHLHLSIIQPVAPTKCTGVLVQCSEPISFAEVFQCHLIKCWPSTPLCTDVCNESKSRCLFEISADVVWHGSCLVMELGQSTSVPEHRGDRRADEDEMVAAIVQQSCCCSSLQASLSSLLFWLRYSLPTFTVTCRTGACRREVDDGRILMQLHSRLKLKDGWIDNDGWKDLRELHLRQARRQKQFSSATSKFTMLHSGSWPTTKIFSKNICGQKQDI